MNRTLTVLAVGLGLSLAGCGDETLPTPTSEAADPARVQPGEIVLLDEHPLYFMRSNTDYGFDAYRRGASTATPGPPASRDAARQGRSWACTCFATAPAGEGPLFGRNFDWWNRASLLLLAEPQNALASLSMVDLRYLDFPATVGLEQLRGQRDRIAQRAPYYPFDGVNERGVAIGLMAVPAAQAPQDPTKTSLYDLALIRLVLDYAIGVDHAVELLRGCNYRVGATPVHFLIADASGAAALVEYVGGELRVTRAPDGFLVATNFVVYGSQAPLSTGCWRYDRAYSSLLARGGIVSPAEAMDLLSRVSQDITMWSAVYDLRRRAVEVVPGRRYGRTYTASIVARSMLPAAPAWSRAQPDTLSAGGTSP
jgi:hypothetical protein